MNTQAITNTSALGSAPVSRPARETKRRVGETLVKLGAILFYLISGFVIYAGWKLRGREYFHAESGPGYWLGIVGSAFMLILLLYPLRKRMKFMSTWGPVRYWFRFHMMLGVVGPICILFHANFSIGSINSTVALTSMILVASSGLIGRYIYTKIHYGLYGRRMNLQSMVKELEEEKGDLHRLFSYAPDVRSRLLKFSNSVLNHSPGFWYSVGIFFFMGMRTRWMYRRLRKPLVYALRRESCRRGWNKSVKRREIKKARGKMWQFLSHIHRVSEFNVYERLFSFWHLLHMPLMVMMIISAVFHVIAVHAY